MKYFKWNHGHGSDVFLSITSHVRGFFLYLQCNEWTAGEIFQLDHLAAVERCVIVYYEYKKKIGFVLVADVTWCVLLSNSELFGRRNAGVVTHRARSWLIREINDGGTGTSGHWSVCFQSNLAALNNACQCYLWDNHLDLSVCVWVNRKHECILLVRVWHRNVGRRCMYVSQGVILQPSAFCLVLAVSAVTTIVKYRMSRKWYHTDGWWIN